MGEPMPREIGSGSAANVINLDVVLVLDALDPLIATPDFLQESGIVGKDARPSGPIEVTPERSCVTFDGGIKITAERRKLSLEQVGAWLTPEEVVTPGIAATFLRAVEGVRCTAIGINPIAHKAVETVGGKAVNRMLLSQGEPFKQGDTVPAVSLKVTYSMGPKTVTLGVLDGSLGARHGVSPGVMFIANFHRSLRAGAGARQEPEPSAVLDSWRSDLSEFLGLVEKFSVWERQQ